MEALLKYIPFIDFILSIDKEKYIKFINIRKWIISGKKKYSLSDLNKIEQSIITQYKNLLVDNVNVPKNLASIFAPLKFKEFVNLCSDDDDEDDDGEINAQTKQVSNKISEINLESRSKENPKTVVTYHTSNNNKKLSRKTDDISVSNDSDNDLEIVSIDYMNEMVKVPSKDILASTKEVNTSIKDIPIPSSTKQAPEPVSATVVPEYLDIDEISKGLLSKIDKLTEDDLKNRKVHEPINYAYQQSNHENSNKNKDNNDESKISERRQYSDVKDGEVTVQNVEEINGKKLYSNKVIETIDLDSCSDSDDGPSTSKAAADKAEHKNASNTEQLYNVGTFTKDKEIRVLKRATQQDVEKVNDHNVDKMASLYNSIDSIFSEKDVNLNELFDEKKNSNYKLSDHSPAPPHIEQLPETNNNKENAIAPTCNSNVTANNIHNVNQDQLKKVFYGISNNSNNEFDSILATVLNVNTNSSPGKAKTVKNNFPSVVPNETPPPSPPINNNEQSLHTAIRSLQPVVYPVNKSQRPSQVIHQPQQQDQQVKIQLQQNQYQQQDLQMQQQQKLKQQQKQQLRLQLQQKQERKLKMQQQQKQQELTRIQQSQQQQLRMQMQHKQQPQQYYQQQQHLQQQEQQQRSQQHQTPTLPLTPHYNQNFSFAPSSSNVGPKPKINMNDPRIRKQLQTIKNSPVFGCLPIDTILMNVCTPKQVHRSHNQQQQQQQYQQLQYEHQQQQHRQQLQQQQEQKQYEQQQQQNNQQQHQQPRQQLQEHHQEQHQQQQQREHRQQQEQEQEKQQQRQNQQQKQHQRPHHQQFEEQHQPHQKQQHQELQHIRQQQLHQQQQQKQQQQTHQQHFEEQHQRKQLNQRELQQQHQKQHLHHQDHQHLKQQKQQQQQQHQKQQRETQSQQQHQQKQHIKQQHQIQLQQHQQQKQQQETQQKEIQQLQTQPQHQQHQQKQQNQLQIQEQQQQKQQQETQQSQTQQQQHQQKQQQTQQQQQQHQNQQLQHQQKQQPLQQQETQQQQLQQQETQQQQQLQKDSIKSCDNKTNNINTTLNKRRKSSESVPSINHGDCKRQDVRKLELDKQENDERKVKSNDTLEELDKQDLRSKLLSTLTPCKDQLTILWSQQKHMSNNGENNNIVENEQEKDKEKSEKSEITESNIIMIENRNDLSNTKKNTESKDKKNSNNSIIENEKEKEEKKSDKSKATESIITIFKKNNRFRNTKKNTKSKDGKKESETKIHRKTKNVRGRLNRIYKELKCTFKGFDQIHDYIPKIIEGKHKSSVQTRSVIRNQLSNATDCSDDSDINVSQSSREEHTPRPITRKRRSCMYSPHVMTNQLDQSSDYSDSESDKSDIMKSRSIKLRRRTSEFFRDSSNELMLADDAASSVSCFNIAKRRKIVDKVSKLPRSIQASTIVYNDSTTSSESHSTSDYENSVKKLKENCINNQPFITLTRMSEEFIERHTKRKQEVRTNNVLNVHLIELMEKAEKLQTTTEPPKKSLIPKILNNDCQMTIRNTRFCVLCSTKPSDLTNHYIRKHKGESYVSRLDWSQLDDLIINTPMAKLQPESCKNTLNCYLVKCPFCDEKLVDTFMNLYNHYSSHTGEFAYQCSHCHFLKPYRVDIQSHIKHSKPCRGSNVHVVYRYPPNTQCIYLHYCSICNFVQLNEANVLKHLREHHDTSKAIASNVQKCILAAISDGPELNEPQLTPQQDRTDRIIRNDKDLSSANTSNETQINKTDVKFKVDDDDIPVTNEPCLDDIFEGDKFALEEQLKQIREEPAYKIDSSNIMTAKHFTDSLLKNSQGNDTTTTIQTHPSINIVPERQKPVIWEIEEMENDEIQTAVKTPTSKYNTYEKYRSYPNNVNYLGLYKCMIDDCYYSTDRQEEMLKHLDNHSLEMMSNEYLQCPYCIIPIDQSLTSTQLIEHVNKEHQHLIYQCSTCCYRSCEASNVFVHQKSHHSNTSTICKIYKCLSNKLNTNNKQLDLNQQILKHVNKISCGVCHMRFYNTNLLISHLKSAHKINECDVQMYSCIYCVLTTTDTNYLRLHVATKHPGEVPYIYNHNTQINKNEDTISSLNIINLSEPVEYVEIKSVVCDSVEENQSQDVADVKPDIKELLQMNEETVIIRLGKLTSHTGVAPNNLYRCPEITCGGFFSIFDLWLRHMKIRHHCLECQCPHCPESPATEMRTLDSFATHFEEHRRHMFICFYCSVTNPNEATAKQHAVKEHGEFGTMRFEQIRFNINYSYSVIIQTDLFKEREEFISEFLAVLDKRLKNMEAMEIQMLKHQWLVQDGALWMEDFANLLSNRKVALRCLIKECNFRTVNEDNLFRHMRASHVIKGTKFCCSKCNYRLECCNSFDEIYDHIKLHSDSIFICAACAMHSPSRFKISNHIRDRHAARDVPVVQLFKMNEQVFNKMYIVFSNNHLTFSTMKNCFCCSEKNMSGDVFRLHLKCYHKLALNYYCECCIKFPFKSLDEVKPHFEQFHSSEHIKIRCELAAHKDLCVVSLNEFQIKLSNEKQERNRYLMDIKEEPKDAPDDNVILLEDDDIIVEKSLRDEQTAEERPKLKCVSLNNLMEPINTVSTSLSTFQTNSVVSNYHNQQMSSMNFNEISTFENNHLIPVVSANTSTNITDAIISHDNIHYNTNPMTISPLDVCSANKRTLNDIYMSNNINISKQSEHIPPVNCTSVIGQAWSLPCTSINSSMQVTASRTHTYERSTCEPITMPQNITNPNIHPSHLHDFHSIPNHFEVNFN